MRKFILRIMDSPINPIYFVILYYIILYHQIITSSHQPCVKYQIHIRIQDLDSDLDLSNAMYQTIDMIILFYDYL